MTSKSNYQEILMINDIKVGGNLRERVKLEVEKHNKMPSYKETQKVDFLYWQKCLYYRFTKIQRSITS